MKRASLVAALLVIFVQHAVAGGSCSARDDRQYCTCAYDRRCVSHESSCQCVAYGNTLPTVPPPPPAISPPTPPPVVTPPPSPPIAAGRLAKASMRLAKTAIDHGDMDIAKTLIEEARVTLLDQSIVTKTFDIASFEPIKAMITARKLLDNHDPAGSLREIDRALGLIETQSTTVQH